MCFAKLSWFLQMYDKFVISPTFLHYIIYLLGIDSFKFIICDKILNIENQVHAYHVTNIAHLYLGAHIIVTHHIKRYLKESPWQNLDFNLHLP